jgi:alcohol dehydrogenase
VTDRFLLDRDGFDAPDGTRIVFGPGRADQTGELARSLRLQKVLLVTDPAILAAGHAGRVQRSLESTGIAVHLFDTTTPEPTTADVDRCLQAVRAVGDVDGYVAVGGGSSIDTAKGANYLAENGGHIPDYRGFAKAKRPLKPLIAIPTTAGTGSEVQSFALIADEGGHHKIAFGDPSALPRVAILDPTLTLSQPRPVTANAGIDTLVHCVETAVTRARSAYSTMYSREAFRLTVENLPQVLAHPQNVEARGRMQLAACFAGLAIEHSMLGAAHAAANPLSACYSTIHGRAVGITVLEVVRWNAADPATQALYADLARCAGLALGRDPVTKAVEALIVGIDELRSLAEIPRASAAGLVAQDIPALAREAASQWTAGFNPRPIAAADFERLYERLLAT